MAPLYHVLNYTFFVVHSLLVLFILTGWWWPRARPWHLALCILTGLSWTALGFFYGWGYCPLTDWHWQVRQALGYETKATSYLKFLFDATTGLSVNAVLVDAAAVISLVAATSLSVFLMSRARQRNRPQ